MTTGYDPVENGAQCYVCPLFKTVVPVPPMGAADGELVIVGEAPGYQEVQQGKPFIGASGVLLDEMLETAGFKRSRAFITNALLCRAEVPGMQGKEKFEVKTYLQWLNAENKRRKKAAKEQKTNYVPLNSPFDCCAPRLWRELQFFEEQALKRGQPNGAVVLALGNSALMAVAGKDSIMKWRGSPLPIQVKTGHEKTLAAAPAIVADPDIPF